MNEEQIAKAREAKSAEELLALAKGYGIEDFTEKDAEDLYEQLHTSGKLTDEELENVSGGCSVKVNGTSYTVITPDKKCFTGKFEDAANYYPGIGGIDSCSLWDTRGTWYTTTLKGERCGRCYHLGLKSGSGYCEVEHG